VKFDLVVIGSGPSGQKAAVQAAKLGRSVAVIERQQIGGACLHTGTIPSKSLREAALNPELGRSVRGVMQRALRVIQDEAEGISDHFVRNKIHYIPGRASLLSAQKVLVVSAGERLEIEGGKIVLAVGTRPRRPKEMPWDSGVVHDSDTILGLGVEPKSMLVIGAGVIGCEYASIFQQAGVKVTLLESKPDFLRTIDQELVSVLAKEFVRRGLELILGADASSITKIDTPLGPRAEVVIGGKRRVFDLVLVCQGRTGNSDGLGLSQAGVEVDERGLIKVDRNYRTSVPSIYAVGDIIGSPALAAASYEQGRLAALHAMTDRPVHFPDTFPTGIYTIPEISAVGPTEAELRKRRIKFVVGRASYAETARGKMIGELSGLLKLLVHQKTRRIMGVHIIGPGATELVHIGQCAMAFGATADYFVENVFNYPTLAEAYKVAAFNALNQLHHPSA
jgi:NAD(P) transhydrogenase